MIKKRNIAVFIGALVSLIVASVLVKNSKNIGAAQNLVLPLFVYGSWGALNIFAHWDPVKSLVPSRILRMYLSYILNGIWSVFCMLLVYLYFSDGDMNGYTTALVVAVEAALLLLYTKKNM